MIALISVIILAKSRYGFVPSMLLYMVLCIPIAEIAMMGITYHFFKVSYALDKRIVVKGDTVEYEVDLVNPTFFVFSPIKVYYIGYKLLFSEAHLEKENTVLLYPHSSKKYKKIITCKYRGSYRIGVDHIEIQGFFGLFKLAYRAVETNNILVYPTVYEMKAIHSQHVMNETTESIVSFDKFDQSIFSEIRQYQQGDALNKIHWKLSARKDEWITKEYEGSVNNKTKIMINNEALTLGHDKNIILEDYLIEGVVALSQYLLENSTPLEMYWHHYETKMVYGTTTKDFTKFYEALAHLSFEHAENAFLNMIYEQTKSQYDQCVLMVFTPEVKHNLSALLLKKKQQGFEVNIVTIKPSGFDIADERVSYDVNHLYRLMDNGIRVYYMSFEEGVCRMEVA